VEIRRHLATLALVLVPAVSSAQTVTSSGSCARTERALIFANGTSARRLIKLRACRVDVSNLTRLPPPDPIVIEPAWVWPGLAVVAIASFAAGFALAKTSTK